MQSGNHTSKTSITNSFGIGKILKNTQQMKIIYANHKNHEKNMFEMQSKTVNAQEMRKLSGNPEKKNCTKRGTIPHLYLKEWDMWYILGIQKSILSGNINSMKNVMF